MNISKQFRLRRGSETEEFLGEACQDPEALALGQPQLARPLWVPSEHSFHPPAVWHNLEENGAHRVQVVT